MCMASLILDGKLSGGSRIEIFETFFRTKEATIIRIVYVVNILWKCLPE